MNLTLDWEFVADAVMGGVSNGTMSAEIVQGRDATVLRGTVSLDNNGGFIQIAADLRPDGEAYDASAWDGIEVDVWGNGQRYDLRLRTDQLQRPWQSFRAEFETKNEWHTIRIPFTEFVPHKTDAKLKAGRLRRVGILAIGREFTAEIAISGMRFY